MNTNAMSSNGQPNPYAWNHGEQGYAYDQDRDVEMNQYPPQHQQPAASDTYDIDHYLNEITRTRTAITWLAQSVETVRNLQQRSLSSLESHGSNQALDSEVANTQAQIRGIRADLNTLAADAARTTDGSQTTKLSQIRTTRSAFQEVLSTYLSEESAYKKSRRDDFARQYRVVNPDASEGEVDAAAEDNSEGGVFQNALKANRAGQASVTLGRVQARHNDLEKINQTMRELVEVMEDMRTLVERQEEPVKQVEESGEQAEANLREGNVHVGKAVNTARSTRKKKWWCLLLTIIIIALAVGLGVGITMAQKTASGN
ncbi:SNARE domain-containing protein [Xylariaceae sp. FL1019]|nr:SNARE domain-containing protein [Xylariaceae sp. FL1019]